MTKGFSARVLLNLESANSRPCMVTNNPVNLSPPGLFAEEPPRVELAFSFSFSDLVGIQV